MASKKTTVTDRVSSLAEPLASQLGLKIWDIEYVKEGASWFLRIYIDKDGGVTIDDCETFSRAIDGPLDEADPIDTQYYLEVSSPGVERELKKDWQFAQYIGTPVRARLIRPAAGGEKELRGELEACNGKTVTIAAPGGAVTVPLSDTAYVRVWDKEDFN